MGRARNLAILGAPVGGGGAPSVLLMSDTFTTNRAAGAVNGTAAEPGPSDTRTVTDTPGGITISGGDLIFASAYTAVGNPGIWWGARTRAGGLAMVSKVTCAATNMFLMIGWDGNQTGAVTEGAYLYNANIRATENDTPNFPNPITNTSYYLAVVLLSRGFHLFIKGGAYSAVTRLWRSYNSNTAIVYPAVVKIATAGSVINVHQIDIRQFNGALSTDTGLAMLSTTAVSSTAYTADGGGNTSPGDFEIALEVTAPAVLDGEATTRTGLYYRADADLTPAWHAYFDGTGAFRLDSIAADGTRTNRVNVAAVIAGGQTRTLKVIARDTKHDCFTAAGAAITAGGLFFTVCGSQVDASLNDDITRVVPVAAATWTLGKLEAYPITSTAFAPLDAALDF